MSEDQVIVAADQPKRFICMGKRVALDEAEFQKGLATYREAISADKLAELDGSGYIQPVTIGPVYADGLPGMVFIRADSDTAARAFCGAALDVAYDQVPEDGRAHDVTCDRCGNVSSVRKTVPAIDETALSGAQ